MNDDKFVYLVSLPTTKLLARDNFWIARHAITIWNDAPVVA